MTLLNTVMKRELDHLARLLHMAVDYKKEIGFRGQFYIEPKPKEPTKHQYDSDAAASLNFLRQYDLLKHFKLNIETNHATLAGHTMQHDLQTAAAVDALGSIDANYGDVTLGWDTDQFRTDLYLTTQTMLVVLGMGGFTTGGLNFDAKVRRESFEPEDIFYAHIWGMEAFARGLKTASAIRRDGRLAAFVQKRYASWDDGIGARIQQGKRCATNPLPPLRRLRAWFDLQIAFLKASKCRSGCLIGNFSLEASDQSELIRRRLAEMFKDIIESIIYCLKAAADAGELSASTNVRDVANFLYSSWHGAILQSKVDQSTKPLELFKKVLFNQILR